MTTETPNVRTSATQVRGEATDSFTPRRPETDETKTSFLTTELWLTLAGIAALIVTYNVADDPSLSLWRTCLLSTLLGMAYVVSRGWAKSGSPIERWRDDHRAGRY